MKKVRHRVEKIHPDVTPGFDQQFWPVLMAVCVVCSIAAGAIVTVLTGPWMWGSLLILPAAAGTAIFLLYQLDDTKLRRSLQMAILASLALHLLVMIGTSLLVIFGTSLPEETPIVAKQPTKKIVITNKSKQFVFQQTNKHETPEPEEKPEQKKDTATAQTQPQPIPVPETQKTVSSQLVKRREERPTAARMEQQQSKKHRQTRDIQPVSAAASSTTASPNSKGAATAPSAAAANMEVRRQNNASASAATRSKSVEPAPAASTAQTTATQPQSRRRELTMSSTSTAADATARIPRSSVRIPKVTPSKVNTESQKTESNTASKTERSIERSTEISRRPQTQSVVKKSSSTPRRTQAALSTPTTASNRRKRQDVKVAQVPKSSQQKSRSVSTNRPTPRVAAAPTGAKSSTKNSPRSTEARAIMVTRSHAGMTGSSRSKNMGRVEGGQPSPTNLASNSSSRRQSSPASQEISLSSLQRSNRSESGRAPKSQRILKSQTSQAATRTGSRQPARRSAQAAAADIQSSAAPSQQKLASEKGSAMMDWGPPKVAPEVTSERRGGGGQPQISDSMAQQSRSSRGRATQALPVPSGDQPGPAHQAVAVSDTSPLATEQTPEEGALSRPETPSSSAATKGTDAKAGATVSETSVAVDGGAARRVDNASFSSNMNDLAHGEQSSAAGNARTRLAQAPTVSGQVRLGNDEGRSGTSATPSPQDGQFESSAIQVSRRSVEVMGGAKSSVLGAATNVAASSLVGLPLFDPGTGQAKRRVRSDAAAGDNPSESQEQRTRGDQAPRVRTSMNTGNGSDSPTANARRLTATESETGAVSRKATETGMGEAGSALDIDAPEGPMGLADTTSRRVGRPNATSPNSDNLAASETRFKRSDFGGQPTFSPTIAIAQPAFANRNPAALSSSGPRTEAAIEFGLEFLARHQLPDGSWTLGQFDQEDPFYQNQLNSDAAATGLALLAFQGAGYTHREFKYKAQIQKALDWMTDHQTTDGCLFVESDQASNDSCRLYSHAIAALALTEAYGMTQDPQLRAPTQRALDYIADTQDPSKGGWRYFAERRKRSSDTSVTGWMMMALKSGKLAGLKVQNSTLEQIESWLRVAQDPNAPSEFRYNPYATDSQGKSRRHGRDASITMTSVGLLMQVYSGWKPDDARFLKGADALLRQLPSDNTSRERDTYYWYYATQVMKHAGGAHWEKWSKALHPLLVGTQEKTGELRGSWHPYQPVPDRWAPQGGRIYVTTMNLLSLEVRYRLLPLYENTIK